MSLNLLLTGPRGAGKSAVVSRVLELLPGLRAGGYVTRRIGPRERPEGHMLRDLVGPERIIAHRDLRDGPRFGPFRVDLEAFETTGATSLRRARASADLIVADEIGRMEEGARTFQAELETCLASGKPFLGVLSDRGGEVVAGLLARQDVRVAEVTEAGRDVLPGAVAAALRWELGGAEALQPPSADGVILAGGRGVRLTPDKGWLEVGGRPMVERVRAAVEPLVKELLVSGSAEVATRLNLACTPDEIPDAGPLSAIAGALAVASAGTILVAAWDMPFLSPALGAHMASLAAGSLAGPGLALGLPERFDAVAPRTTQGPEPLFAVYRGSCLRPAREALAAGGRRPDQLLEAVNTRWVGGPELAVFGDPEVIFFSVNTAEDLERARAIAE